MKEQRGQGTSRMAKAWLLKSPRIIAENYMLMEFRKSAQSGEEAEF